MLSSNKTKAVAVAAALAAVAATGLATIGAQASAPRAASFGDVPGGSQFATPIGSLAGQGVIQGYPDGTFRPAGDVTRQALAAFLAKAIGADPAACSAAQGAVFTDVPAASPFCGAIVALAAAGVVAGYPDGGFHPDALVTRQAAAAYIYRAHAVLAHVTDPSNAAATATKFVDVDVSSPFSGDVAYLSSSAIAGGYADGSFQPGAPVTRQAAASFIYKFEVTEGLITAAPTPVAPTPTPVVTPTPTPPAGGTAGGTTGTQSGVHPGAFCSPPGAHGYADEGTLMVCSTTAASPDRARWHAA